MSQFTEEEIYVIKSILRRMLDFWGVCDRASLYWKNNIDANDDELATMDYLIRLSDITSQGLGDDLSELEKIIGINEMSLFESKEDHDEQWLVCYDDHLKNRERRINKMKVAMS